MSRTVGAALLKSVLRLISIVQRSLPQLDRRVWLLSGGRLLSQIGNGFTLVYAPIFFANQVGLSTTAVGIGIGSGSITGILGRFLGGTGADSPRWGRRTILLWSAFISAVADMVLAIAFNIPTFVIGNMLMGFGIGLYWPATEAMVADLTTDQQRNEAFALVRWADHIGLSLGIILGGILIDLTGRYRALFVVDGMTYLLFFGVIYWAIAETQRHSNQSINVWRGWMTALRDRRLQLYVLINSFFTLYLAQGQTTLPLYFSRVVQTQDVGSAGFSPSQIGALFTWNVVLTALLQLPISKQLNRYSRLQALMLSAVFWGFSFGGVFLLAMMTSGLFWWAGLTLAIMAIAAVIYLPTASAFVVDMAPESLIGIYLSANSQCWAIGYFIGPALGGWALDQGDAIAHYFWLSLTVSGPLLVGLLVLLDTWISHPNRK